MPCHRKREANRKTSACGKNDPPAEEVGRLPRVGAQSPYRIMGHYGKSGETGEEKLAAHQAEIARETKATRLRRALRTSRRVSIFTRQRVYLLHSGKPGWDVGRGNRGQLAYVGSLLHD